MKFLLASTCVALVLSVCLAEPVSLYDGDAPSNHGKHAHPKHHHQRERRAAGDTERDCSANPPYYPPTAVDTTEQLAQIRVYMADYKYDAYIVPSEDAHGSEYIAEPDQRRKYISGFSGSSGVAVITADHAGLWTDGRYFIQGDRELWCDWMLMKSGQAGVPTTAEWLVNTGSDATQGADLPEGARIGFDPTLMSISTVEDYMSEIIDSGRNLTMVGSVDNLVDMTWVEIEGSKPAYPDESLLVLEFQYTGQTWDEKIGVIRGQLQDAGADKLIVPKLDEVAWVFNMRGKDIPYNPMFISYAIIGTSDITLYAYDKAGRIDADSDVQDHLLLNVDCGDVCITVKDYSEFDGDIINLASGDDQIWFSDISSYFIYESIPEANRYIEASPILLTKSQKNEVEIQGMKDAHLSDSIAICETAAWLQETMDNLEDPSVGDIDVASELVVEQKVIEFREQQENFQGLSFGTISSFGPNGAVIHYSSSPETDVPITNQGIFLLDSGGQYLSGTCDITRSFHYGTPTDFMKEAYTRVLMGHIDLVQVHFRTGVYGRDIDAIARAPLWENGLDFRHGTGHGIGHFLNVHEGPGRINLGYNPRQEPIHLGMFFSDGPASISLGYNSRHEPIYPSMFFSDEPGYYDEVAGFGLRIEDIMYSIPAVTDHHFNNPTYEYMTFEMISFVPLEPNLIDFSLMTTKQIDWYNEYNAHIKDKVYPLLSSRAKTWVDSKTEFYDASSSTHVVASLAFVIMTSLAAIFLQ